MAKLFIPACGDRLTLIQPWTFDLYLEHRNLKFAEVQEVFTPTKGSYYYNVTESGDRYSGKLKRVSVTLAAGSILECDRVYIRTFNKSRIHDGDDYDSITWKLFLKGKNGQPKSVKNGRFWVKLHACNDIEYELDFDGVYRDRVKAVKAVMET